MSNWADTLLTAANAYVLYISCRTKLYIWKCGPSFGVWFDYDLTPSWLIASQACDRPGSPSCPELVLEILPDDVARLFPFLRFRFLHRRLEKKAQEPRLSGRSLLTAARCLDFGPALKMFVNIVKHLCDGLDVPSYQLNNFSAESTSKLVETQPPKSLVFDPLLNHILVRN